MAPLFLTLDEVLEVHRDQLTRYGGSSGIRDLGLLQSALAQPAAKFAGEFLHPDLFEMAAATDNRILFSTWPFSASCR
jgi:death-on-curing protein